MADAKTFALNLADFAAKAKGNADQVVRKVAIDALSNIVLRSPVDTGRFRANWLVSVDEPAQDILDDVDPSGAEAIQSGSAALSDAVAGPAIFITNNLPYALRLENGWSKQAPSGMVRLAAAEFQTYVDDAVKSLP